MDDMRLVQALQDLRRELTAEVRAVRDEAVRGQLAMMKRLVWTVTALALALGGSELVKLAL